MFSNIIFCGRDDTQCMNTYKTIGTIGVSLSVLAYALDDRLFPSCSDKSSTSYEPLKTSLSNDDDDNDSKGDVTTRRRLSEVEVVIKN